MAAIITGMRNFCTKPKCNTLNIFDLRLYKKQDPILSKGYFSIKSIYKTVNGKFFSLLLTRTPYEPIYNFEQQTFINKRKDGTTTIGKVITKQKLCEIYNTKLINHVSKVLESIVCGTKNKSFDFHQVTHNTDNKLIPVKSSRELATLFNSKVTRSKYKLLKKKYFTSKRKKYLDMINSHKIVTRMKHTASYRSIYMKNTIFNLNHSNRNKPTWCGFLIDFKEINLKKTNVNYMQNMYYHNNCRDYLTNNIKKYSKVVKNVAEKDPCKDASKGNESRDIFGYPFNNIKKYCEIINKVIANESKTNVMIDNEIRKKSQNPYKNLENFSGHIKKIENKSNQNGLNNTELKNKLTNKKTSNSKIKSEQNIRKNIAKLDKKLFNLQKSNKNIGVLKKSIADELSQKDLLKTKSFKHLCLYKPSDSGPVSFSRSISKNTEVDSYQNNKDFNDNDAELINTSPLCEVVDIKDRNNNFRDYKSKFNHDFSETNVKGSIHSKLVDNANLSSLEKNIGTESVEVPFFEKCQTVGKKSFAKAKQNDLTDKMVLADGESSLKKNEFHSNHLNRCTNISDKVIVSTNETSKEAVKIDTKTDELNTFDKVLNKDIFNEYKKYLLHTIVQQNAEKSLKEHDIKPKEENKINKIPVMYSSHVNGVTDGSKNCFLNPLNKSCGICESAIAHNKDKEVNYKMCLKNCCNNMTSNAKSIFNRFYRPNSNNDQTISPKQLDMQVGKEVIDCVHLVSSVINRNSGYKNHDDCNRPEKVHVQKKCYSLHHKHTWPNSDKHYERKKSNKQDDDSNDDENSNITNNVVVTQYNMHSRKKKQHESKDHSNEIESLYSTSPKQIVPIDKIPSKDSKTPNKKPSYNYNIMNYAYSSSPLIKNNCLSVTNKNNCTQDKINIKNSISDTKKSIKDSLVDESKEIKQENQNLGSKSRVDTLLLLNQLQRFVNVPKLFLLKPSLQDSLSHKQIFGSPIKVREKFLTKPNLISTTSVTSKRYINSNNLPEANDKETVTYFESRGSINETEAKEIDFEKKSIKCSTQQSDKNEQKVSNVTKQSISNLKMSETSNDSCVNNSINALNQMNSFKMLNTIPISESLISDKSSIRDRNSYACIVNELYYQPLLTSRYLKPKTSSRAVYEKKHVKSKSRMVKRTSNNISKSKRQGKKDLFINYLNNIDFLNKLGTMKSINVDEAKNYENSINKLKIKEVHKSAIKNEPSNHPRKKRKSKSNLTSNSISRNMCKYKIPLRYTLTANAEKKIKQCDNDNYLLLKKRMLEANYKINKMKNNDKFLQHLSTNADKPIGQLGRFVYSVMKPNIKTYENNQNLSDNFLYGNHIHENALSGSKKKIRNLTKTAKKLLKAGLCNNHNNNGINESTAFSDWLNKTNEHLNRVGTEVPRTDHRIKPKFSSSTVSKSNSRFKDDGNVNTHQYSFNSNLSSPTNLNKPKCNDEVINYLRNRISTMKSQKTSERSTGGTSLVKNNNIKCDNNLEENIQFYQKSGTNFLLHFGSRINSSFNNTEKVEPGIFKGKPDSNKENIV